VPLGNFEHVMTAQGAADGVRLEAEMISSQAGIQAEG
jgi:hypothetical protein